MIGLALQLGLAAGRSVNRQHAPFSAPDGWRWERLVIGGATISFSGTPVFYLSRNDE